jgi:hypothetical protein
MAMMMMATAIARWAAARWDMTTTMMVTGNGDDDDDDQRRWLGFSNGF